MDFLGVKNWLQLSIGSKTLFLGSLVGVFSSVLRVSVSVVARSFALASLACFL
ncbi:hypothetical protein E5L54_06790 [Helicobacter pylori]|nr:hypothetical protein E5L54_06790 [Helicobacter pylori]